MGSRNALHRGNVYNDGSFGPVDSDGSQSRPTQGEPAMETLIKQVAQARRRLMLVRFLTALRCWTASLLAAVVAIGVAKLFPISAGPYWAGAWISGAFAAGLLVAGVWTWIVRPNPLLAAIELDHRFALKERVSSALALSPAEQQTEIGQALVSDAVRRVQRLDVPQKFGVPLRRLHALPLVAALLAFGLTFFSDRVSPTAANANSTTQAEVQQIQQSAEKLARKLAQPRREADEEGPQRRQRSVPKNRRGNEGPRHRPSTCRRPQSTLS